MRRLIKERDFEKYLGIQRPLDKSRVKEIREYVTTSDACFPTVSFCRSSRYATYDDQTKTLQLSNHIDPEDPDRNILYRQIAKVIDGQHRIEGLKELENIQFDVNISVFVDIDVAQEEYLYIFSTVNLAQTKVNRSLAYDLLILQSRKAPRNFATMLQLPLMWARRVLFITG